MGKKRIGILTSGGDCPGLNAAIRSLGKTAILRYDFEVVGFLSGFAGLISGEYIILDEAKLSGILTLGGTILGTSREKPFKNYQNDSEKVESKPEAIQRTYETLGLECLICIGGNGTQKTAHKLAKMGLKVIGLPKTIDNDIWGTDITFGFDSAVSIATEAIDRLHTTANSHRRIMVVEVMGHHAGWLALYSGMASGGDVILIPEIPYTIETIAAYLEDRYRKQKPYSIVVVAEGIPIPEPLREKYYSPAHYIADSVQKLTGLESRETILGYVQRGGTPTAYDRVLATRLGSYAVELIMKRKWNRMVCVRNGEIDSVKLEEVSGKLKLVEPDHPMIEEARSLGTCFGNEGR
ncbi:6-phosphofructokinase [Thermospira aquatica]|uniref:ATP-dependent 6-phosphofructokinase n=1 Tax=Thermospira aquatica TaxID=2828656 RepID=A0AAX3BB49_9SPIR|nr:ATP-dependent 6-phosphofructokinase [Thermospira aquatica]URA09458.1 6-phosphofructokinase [Thermospira aquatica]